MAQVGPESGVFVYMAMRQAVKSGLINRYQIMPSEKNGTNQTMLGQNT